MENKWSYVPLGDLISLQRGHDLPSQNRINGSVPIMGSSGITGFHNEVKCLGPGVVVGRSGDSMGVVSYINCDYWPLNTCLYVTDFKGNDVRYIYYLLQQINFEQFNSGSAQKSLNRNAVYPFEVYATRDKFLQKKIGEFIFKFEEKITLNRQINQTLEQMAQTLFKSWFVDFDPVIDNALDAGNEIPDSLQERAEQRRLLRAKADFKPLPAETRALFPSEFEETELGWVPKGWTVETLETCIDVLESGRRPKGGVAAYTTGIPSIGAESIGGVGNFDYEKLKFVPHDFFSKMKAGKVQDYDVLLYKDGGKPGEFKPRIGMYGKGFPFKEFGINEHVFRIRSKKIGQFFLYCQLGSERVFYDLSVRGGKAAIPGVNQEDVKQQLLIFPSEDLLILFNQYVESKFEKILLTSSESRQLTKLRDVLLPKLISGELALDDLPEDITEVVEAV